MLWAWGIRKSHMSHIMTLCVTMLSARCLPPVLLGNAQNRMYGSGMVSAGLQMCRFIHVESVDM